MVTSEFDSYIIYHEEKHDAPEKVVITCFYEEKTVSYINFYEGDVPAPEILPHSLMKLTYPMSRYSELITTLRYEKPLYISIYEDKSVLSTVREPVGEQEGH